MSNIYLNVTIELLKVTTVFNRVIPTAKKPFIFTKIYFNINSFIGFKVSSNNKNLAVMASRKNTMIPLTFWSRSKQNEEEYPGTLNCHSGNESSNFVSGMTKASIFPVIWSVRTSNLFLKFMLKEFMLRLAKTSMIWLKFFIRIYIIRQTSVKFRFIFSINRSQIFEKVVS